MKRGIDIRTKEHYNNIKHNVRNCILAHVNSCGCEKIGQNIRFRFLDANIWKNFLDVIRHEVINWLMLHCHLRILIHVLLECIMLWVKWKLNSVNQVSCCCCSNFTLLIHNFFRIICDLWVLIFISSIITCMLFTFFNHKHEITAGSYIELCDSLSVLNF